ncbi:MAG: sigma-70 family RNA polymerase sigma factor [Fulvivirga sp.]|uniref:RNA polymerase sigma factor n=1 Tax=Fulvivirga sp. TaxID=1931237 RepID=UPI0032EA9250
MNQLEHSEFIEFLERYKKLVVKIAGVYIKDKDQRDDLIQDIILQLWRAFPKYNNQQKGSTWCYKIALNVTMSFLRRSYKVAKGHEGYARQHIIDIDADDHLPEMLNKLYEAMEILNPIDKAIVMLHLEATPVEESATIIGLSATNFTTRLHRAKSKLKEHLTQKT